MKTHETPPLDQPDWDLFLAEAKTNIDRRTAPRTTHVRPRQRTARRVLSAAAVSGLALSAVLILTNRENPAGDVAKVQDGAVTPAPEDDATPLPSRASMSDYTTAGQVLTAASVSSASQTSLASEAHYWRVESVWKQDSDSGIPGDSDSGTRIIWQGHKADSVLFQQGAFAFREGALTKLPPASFTMQQTSFSWDQLDELTTSPAELAKLLKSQTIGLRGDPDQYVFTFIGELLAESPASPQLRSALWEVAADIRGANLNGQDEDATGRDGWSITVGPQTYLVDPQTGNILETRYRTDNVSYTSTIVSAGPSDTAPKSVDDVKPAT